MKPQKLPVNPIELIIAKGLIANDITYTSEPSAAEDLDFYLPDFDIYLECKEFHSDRIAKQTAKVSNIIIIQGKIAALSFVKMISAQNELRKSLKSAIDEITRLESKLNKPIDVGALSDILDTKLDVIEVGFGKLQITGLDEAAEAAINHIKRQQGSHERQ